MYPGRLCLHHQLSPRATFHNTTEFVSWLCLLWMWDLSFLYPKIDSYHPDRVVSGSRGVLNSKSDFVMLVLEDYPAPSIDSSETHREQGRSCLWRRWRPTAVGTSPDSTVLQPHVDMGCLVRVHSLVPCPSTHWGNTQQGHQCFGAVRPSCPSLRGNLPLCLASRATRLDTAQPSDLQTAGSERPRPGKGQGKQNLQNLSAANLGDSKKRVVV